MEWLTPGAVRTSKSGANIETSATVMPALSTGLAHRGTQREAVYKLADECELFIAASSEVTLK
jgi:hypothetical protein